MGHFGVSTTIPDHLIARNPEMAKFKGKINGPFLGFISRVLSLSQPFLAILGLDIHILPIYDAMNIVAGVLESHVIGVYFFPSFQPLKIIFIIQRARHCL